MGLETKLYELITSFSSITDLVSTRVYPLLADETTVEPYIVYQVISAPREHTLKTAVTMVEARVQITCWCKNYYDAITLKEELRQVLDNYSDKDNPSIEEVIQVMYLDDEGDLIDYNAGIDKSKHYGKRLDFRIWFNE